MALGCILLSLVVLTGYGGLVSLCHMTFVGLGAYAMGTWGDGGSLKGLLLAAARWPPCSGWSSRCRR